MKPKEHAKQLIERFEDFAFFSSKETQESNVVWNAKQCALILVDERLQELNFTHIGYGKGIMEGYQKTKVKYWNDVKSEIEKF
jgi:hypothetical protein